MEVDGRTVDQLIPIANLGYLAVLRSPKGLSLGILKLTLANQKKEPSEEKGETKKPNKTCTKKELALELVKEEQIFPCSEPPEQIVLTEVYPFEGEEEVVFRVNLKFDNKVTTYFFSINIDKTTNHEDFRFKYINNLASYIQKLNDKSSLLFFTTDKDLKDNDAITTAKICSGKKIYNTKGLEDCSLLDDKPVVQTLRFRVNGEKPNEKNFIIITKEKLSNDENKITAVRATLQLRKNDYETFFKLVKVEKLFHYTESPENKVPGFCCNKDHIIFIGSPINPKTLEVSNPECILENSLGIKTLIPGQETFFYYQLIFKDLSTTRKFVKGLLTFFSPIQSDENPEPTASMIKKGDLTISTRSSYSLVIPSISQKDSTHKNKSEGGTTRAQSGEQSTKLLSFSNEEEQKNFSQKNSPETQSQHNNSLIHHASTGAQHELYEHFLGSADDGLDPNNLNTSMHSSDNEEIPSSKKKVGTAKIHKSLFCNNISSRKTEPRDPRADLFPVKGPNNNPNQGNNSNQEEVQRQHLPSNFAEFLKNNKKVTTFTTSRDSRDDGTYTRNNGLMLP